MWVYIFEDCDICGGSGKAPGMVGEVMVSDAPCDLCQGQGRRSTNMSFQLPDALLYPGGVNEDLAATEYYP
jgi:DnaJ-class molecular chaperone